MPAYSCHCREILLKRYEIPWFGCQQALPRRLWSHGRRREVSYLKLCGHIYTIVVCGVYAAIRLHENWIRKTQDIIVWLELYELKYHYFFSTGIFEIVTSSLGRHNCNAASLSRFSIEWRSWHCIIQPILDRLLHAWTITALLIIIGHMLY